MSIEASEVHVLYIMGYGHSGSTLLDAVLGNHENLEGVGELCNLQGYDHKEENLCSCGENANNCNFWSDIREAWIRHSGVENIDQYFELQKIYDGWKSPKCWYRLLAEGTRRSNRFKVYSSLTKALFQAISEVSDKPFVIDSSKSPTRAFALSNMKGINLRIIHLVRDGRGIIWSLLKKSSKKGKTSKSNNKWKVVLRAALAWTAVNLQAEIVRKKVGRRKSILIRYEDLICDPAEILGHIGGLIGDDLSPLGSQLEKGASMKIGHIIAGNRLRMKGSIKLEPDFEWKYNLKKSYEKVIEIVGGFLLHRYGY